MRRSIPFRLTGLFVAALFLLGVAEGAAGLRNCAHHDVVLSGVEPAAAHAGPGHGAGHSPEDAVAASSHGATEDHGEAGHAGPCLCLGDCHTGTIAGLPETPSAGIAPAEPTLFGVPAGDRDAVLPGLPPYTLPYAQAPPLVR